MPDGTSDENFRTIAPPRPTAPPPLILRLFPTLSMPTFSIRTALSLALVLGTSQAQAQTGATAAYAHFEARQTHPIGLTPDGTRLLALNSPEGRLSVFDVSNPANPTPVLLAEIPVGLEPV